MNKKFKIAFIGLGSIGKRHLINVVKVLNNRNDEFTIDLIRRKESKKLEEELEVYVSNIYYEDEEIPSDYDVVFIANPTSLHYDAILKFNNKTKHMFIEKPVFDKFEIDVEKIEISHDSIYYVACPLRYTKVIDYVKNEIDFSEVYSVRAICSSYLPDWRPDADYRETYSASKDQGGGVSIDLIHEWDYLIYLLGLPKEILNIRGKFSNLEIDSDDLSVYIAKYDDLLVEVHLDYFGRKSVRELQMMTKTDTVNVDIINSSITYLKENKVVKFDDERNSYQLREIENFFEILDGNKENENDIFKALSTLKIAKRGEL